MDYPDAEQAGDPDFVLSTTSASALDNDKEKAYAAANIPPNKASITAMIAPAAARFFIRSLFLSGDCRTFSGWSITDVFSGAGQSYACPQKNRPHLKST